MRRLAHTFKALSDETRLQMLALLLEEEELCVCDFVGVLGLTQSKASRHLRYLYNTGLVDDRRQGVWMHYRLSPDLTPEQKVLVDAVRDTLGPDDRQDLRRRLAEWWQQKTC